jgi:hypothetical protein
MGNTLSAPFVGAPRTARRALSFSATALGALLAATVLGACDSGNGLLSSASLENVSRSYNVYGLTGTAPALPASYKFTTESLERPQVLANGAVNFDVAFDLTADNRVALYPVRVLVPLPPGGTSAVGMQTSAAVYAQLERAPDKGYTNDSTFVVGVGQTVLLKLAGSGCIYGDPFYAKLVVDSIIVAERRFVIRSLVNRNCGYRALTTGLPKN